MNRAERLARLLRVLAAIIAEPGLNPLELAEKAGVSDRTLRRDLAQLRDLGYEVAYTSGYEVQEKLNLEGRGRKTPRLRGDDALLQAVAHAVAPRSRPQPARPDPERPRRRRLHLRHRHGCRERAVHPAGVRRRRPRRQPTGDRPGASRVESRTHSLVSRGGLRGAGTLQVVRGARGQAPAGAGPGRGPGFTAIAGRLPGSAARGGPRCRGRPVAVRGRAAAKDPRGGGQDPRC